MRITNRMLINNSLYNINGNKSNMDKLNTQLASEKVIQRPSDDPIVAIRALRFRSTISEIDQYLDKNIQDARSWMETTEEVLGSIVSIIGDISEYCNQAVNGYYDSTDKKTIVEELKGFRDQVYNNANADCAGRTIFTGYKTDGMLTYTEECDKTYEITQDFTKDDIDTVLKVVNALDISDVNDSTIDSVDINSIKLPTQQNTYRIRLAYTELDADAGVTLKIGDTELSATIKESTDTDAYVPGDDDIYYLADTGEIMLGKNAYAQFVASDGFSVTYTKTGYDKGELDPTQFFNCIDKTDADSSRWIKYTNRDQDIDYEINFNQTITINTQGKDVFTPDMTRDIDDLIDVVNFAVTANDKKAKLENMYNAAADGSEAKEKYKQLLDLCEREIDFAEENMEKAFGKGLTIYEEHQSRVSLARADVGTKLNRLDLNESRLESQRVTVENLKSTNEDVNLTEVAVELEEASSIYDASLAAASKVVQKKLLDFL